MPGTATVAPKSAAPKARSPVASRAPAKAAPVAKREGQPTTPRTAAPALPAFARSALVSQGQAATKPAKNAPLTAAGHGPVAPHPTAPHPAASHPAAAHPTQPHPTAPHPAALGIAPPKPLALKPHAKLVPLAPKGPATGSGQPLAPHIKEAIQKSLMVDLSAVRLHATNAAQNKAQSLSARAFTFGNDIYLGRGEHPTDLTLISHEAAHVIQQQGGAAVQTWSSDRSDRYEREADLAATAVQSGERFSVRERVESPRVQRLGISDALDYFAGAANNIPGFRMFTIVLGVNPINMEHVDRNAANILRAVVEFIPGGALITQALDKYGVFDKVGSWMSDQLDTLAMTGSAIKKALLDFLDSLSWSDIFHLGDVWDRAQRILTEPIDRIKNFVKGLLEGIWKFVRDAILKPLAQLASKTAGWDLLTAVLGTNPITGRSCSLQRGDVDRRLR